jgi:arginyl-tRNA synthetase
LSASLIARIRGALESGIASLGVDPPVGVALEVPPKPEMGDLASPIAFELARRLKKPPREIAATLARLVEGLEGVDRVEIAGAGYLNVYFDRDRFLRDLAREIGVPHPASGSGKRIVEHTNINPNKAAHIGHLRNAVLGDTLVRALRFLGETVEVQNYITTPESRWRTRRRVPEIRGSTSTEPWRSRGAPLRGLVREYAALPPNGVRLRSAQASGSPRIMRSITTADLYAEVAPTTPPARRAARRARAAGDGPRSLAAFLRAGWCSITPRCSGSTLRPPRESDILALGFSKLALRSVPRFAEEGKARGCWVMDGTPRVGRRGGEDHRPTERHGTYVGRTCLSDVVRPAGKGLLSQARSRGADGRDGDGRWPRAPDGVPPRAAAPRRTRSFQGVWPRRARLDHGARGGGEREHPSFGGAEHVLQRDRRASYFQKVVAQGLEALGHAKEASASVHFSYENRPDAAQRHVLNDLLGHGIPLNDEEMTKPYIEMSGRRGIGVKAEDLLRTLVRQVYDRITKERSAEITDREMREKISVQIAVGALRYYMLRFTKNRVIAFDFEDSLTFEGETGPYLQYAAVRSNNIFNKLREREGIDRARAASLFESVRFSCLDSPDALEHWQIVREMSRLPEIVEQAVASLELSLLARFVFSVAQRFSAFYHRYPILHETDPERRNLRIALNELFLRFMETSFALMGVPLPEHM